MAQYGLGNFIYEFTVEGGSAKFAFFDPLDADNTATTTVAPKDFPEGIEDADSRQVADLAFSQVSEQLNKKRDARLKQKAADAFNENQDAEARARAAQADFLANSEEGSVAPVKEEKDGTKVFNTKSVDADKSSK